MTRLMEQYGLDGLSLEERYLLVGELYASIAEEQEGSPLTDEQVRELERRIAEADAHPERGIPMEVMFQELRARYQR